MRFGPEGVRVDESTLRRRVAEAQAGDERALEDVVRAVRDDVFDLALRMLGDAADASDAAQEVLVRVVTKLSTFRGESGFRTWVYRGLPRYAAPGDFARALRGVLATQGQGTRP